MGLVDRAKNILLQPKQEWPVIAGEATTTRALYKGYIAPLSAIYPVASIIGTAVIGISVPLIGNYRVPFGEALFHGVLSFVLGLVAVYLLALVVEFLAPRFGGTADRLQALKLAAFAYTPAWLAGIFVIIPWFGILGMVGAIYSLYLFYIGLPVLMRSPRERRLPYFLSILVIAILINIVLFFVVASIFGTPGGDLGGRTAALRIDACKTVTKADAEAILGQPVEATPENEGAGECTWSSVNKQIDTASLLVSIQRDGDARQVFEMTKKGNAAMGQLFGAVMGGNAGQAQTIAGLGDEAFVHGIAADGGLLVGTTTLVVRKNDTIFQMTAVTAAKKASLERLKSVAGRAVQTL
jgi:Yip1 domain